MAGIRNCKGGRVAGVETINPTCDCVGIESISQSSDLTRIYINLTNGTTDTFTLPAGAQGPVGPAGPTGAEGTSLIYSDPADHATITALAFETLSSFSTDHTNASKNLVNVGDTIRVYAIYKLTAYPTATGIATQLVINGTGLANLVLSIFPTANASDGLIETFTDIILSDNTIGAMMLRVSNYVKIWNGDPGFTGYQSYQVEFKRELGDIGGATVDFSANNYTISAQASSIVAGDIELQIYQAEKLTSI